MFHSFDMSPGIGNDDNRAERENILTRRMVATSYLAGNCSDDCSLSEPVGRRCKRPSTGAWSADCFGKPSALKKASRGGIRLPK